MWCKFVDSSKFCNAFSRLEWGHMEMEMGLSSPCYVTLVLSKLDTCWRTKTT